MFARAC